MTKEEKNKILRLRANGNSYGQIAEELGVSKNTIASFIKRNEVNQSNELKESNCQNCGLSIRSLPKKKQRKFCSDACRMQWWNNNLDDVNKKAFYVIECKNCSKTFKTYGNRDRKYCSLECYNSSRSKKGDTHE